MVGGEQGEKTWVSPRNWEQQVRNAIIDFQSPIQEESTTQENTDGMAL